MRLENSFTVGAPAEAAWALLMDVPRIVPCMPGATLDEVVDDSHWKATIEDAAIALTNMGLTLRARAVEDALAGSPAGSAAAADEKAADGTSPPSDTNGSADYRRHLACVLTRRALEEALAR